MGVIVDGKAEEVPGLRTLSWLDMPQLRLRKGEDFRSRRTRWIRSIILHTTKGIPGPNDTRFQDIRPGLGAAVDAGLRCSRYWSQDGRQAGAHLVVDFDGTVCCCVDLQTEAANHAGAVNDGSIGIELYQGGNAEMYEGQLGAAVQLVDWLTRRFGIQRQVPHRYLGKPLQRMTDGGDDCVGVFGHRDCSWSRGAGDPGSAIFDRLVAARYEAFDFSAREDIGMWMSRQRSHNVPVADGVPGPMTLRMLKAQGVWNGMWVRRPGDLAPKGPDLVG